MGYSIAVPVKSRKAQQKMIAFLKEHYKPWGVLNGDLANQPFDNSGAIRTEGSLDYDRGKLRLGFNYRGNGYGREWCNWMTFWIAMMIGKKSRRHDLRTTLVGEQVPYIVYNGRKSYPLLPEASGYSERIRREVDGVIVDECGYRANPRPWGYSEGATKVPAHLREAVKRLEKDDKIAQAELKRLTKLWRAYEYDPED